MEETTEKSRYRLLASRLLDRTITHQEELELMGWYHNDPEAEIKIPYEFAENSEDLRLKIFAGIQSKIRPKRKTLKLSYVWTTAAAVMLILSIGLFFYKVKQQQQNHLSITRIEKRDPLPGSNKAVLILSDGSTISLTDAHNGQLRDEGGVSISKNDKGQLIYKMLGKKNAGKNLTNTIKTPFGGQYQVSLEDGTQVWLNAGSSIQFPCSFEKLKERIVKITGEAYFEVKHDKLRPFKVVSDHQVITVHGTHFNVNTYNDDGISKTTLLEGSVDVNGLLIKPTQQLLLTENSAKVISVDVDNVVAWKQGYFKFEAEELESIMQKISRWYNVNVEFKDSKLKKIQFGGIISRFVKLSEVLKMLELTNEVHFEMDNNKIEITKK
ncbi:MAG: FecR family protein [Sphingobacteriaceae bacterium]|nr:FecR family protein [Sphingobacteriaceae bacterium]